MAHLVNNLSRTAWNVITFPIVATKRLAGAALDRLGAKAESGAPLDETPAYPPEPMTPPVRRTAEEAVAREEAEPEEPPAPTDLAGAETEEDEIITPSGIPAADVGTNPDTTETDLHQPGTEPIVDPATVKAVKSEAETMRRASSRDKSEPS